MNESYKTQGIVIGKRDFFEADKILTVFTQDLGKIQIKAKGLKRALAKMAGHLEVFNLVELELIKGKNMYIVIGAQIIDSFEDIKKDFDRTGVYYYFCEVLDKILEEGVRHKNTFAFFLSLLEELKKKETNLLLLTVYFELNVLSYLGFKPEFLVCVGCRDEISGHKFYFSEDRGGILCETCSDKDLYSNKISQNAIKLMRLIVEKDFGFIGKVVMEKEIQEEAKRINAFFLEHVLGRELKSKQFLMF
ncbi:MAG TPA: DNA repair protein RecO [Patescibacteria group bacterium]|nr:DNA repair protein RecO [Patescibacteria group bacterium]